MQQTSTKGVKDKTRVSWEGDPLGIEQEIEISPYSHIVIAQT